MARMEVETGSIDLQELRRVLEKSQKVAGVPKETSDPKNDYQHALRLINNDDEMGHWLLERLTRRGYQPAIKLHTLFKKVEEGDAASLMTLGRLYEDGTILNQDFDRAIQCYVKALRKDEAVARPAIEKLIKEQRASLYSALDKYKELRAIDTELTIAARRDTPTKAEQDEKLRRHLEAIHQQAIEAQVAFLRRSELGHTRRLQDEAIRGAEISGMAMETLRQREEERKKIMLNQDLRGLDMSTWAAIKQRKNHEAREQQLQQSEKRGESLRDQATRAMEARDKGLMLRMMEQDLRGMELTDLANHAMLQHKEELDEFRRRQDFNMAQQQLLLQLWQKSKQERQEQEEAQRQAAQAEADNLAEMALETNDIRMMKYLAGIYHDGTELIRPQPMQCAFWKTCIKIIKGDPKVLCILGHKYEYGEDGYRQNLDVAFEYYLQAHSNYDIENILSRWKEEGREEKCLWGLQEYFDRSRDSYTRKHAAYYMESGRFCQPNWELAYIMYQEVADSIRAEDIAFKLYQRCLSEGNDSEAYDWFQRSGRHKDAMQQDMAAEALLYESGTSRYIDLGQAYDLYMGAERLGDAARVARSQAKAYREGLYGYPVDPERARQWQQKADNIPYFDVI